MKKHPMAVKVLLVAVAAGLLAGCVAGGPRMIRAEQELKAGPDAALIVFLRPNPVAFGGGEFQLWDRDSFIGFIEPVTSVSYRAKPGEHMFLVKAENWEVVKGKVSAGKTYYIWIDPRVGVGAFVGPGGGTRVSLTVLDPHDKRIKDWMMHCRPITLADPSKVAAFEKKYERHVTKAINNVESGKANYATLSPSQGK
jgi:hypothetical protein